MKNVPALTGWLWARQGFALFRQQPVELSTLFFSYMFALLAISIIPVLGGVLPAVLTPVFVMAFMQASRQVESGKRVFPSLLLTGFRSPAFRTLLLLGVLYLLAGVLALAASALMDGGMLWKTMTGQLKMTPEELQQSTLPLAMLFSMAAYTLLVLPLWYAAPLITWQGMGLGKAVFYSFFTVKNAAGAFLVYGVAWLLASLAINFVSVLFALIFGPALAIFIMMPLSVLLATVIYTSFYPTYTEFFGRPDDARQTSPSQD